MAESRIVLALIAKHSGYQGKIRYYQEAILKFQDELAIINKVFSTFVTNNKTSSILAKNIRSLSYFARGELNRRIIERLKPNFVALVT